MGKQGPVAHSANTSLYLPKYRRVNLNLRETGNLSRFIKQEQKQGWQAAASGYMNDSVREAAAK